MGLFGRKEGRTVEEWFAFEEKDPEKVYKLPGIKFRVMARCHLKNYKSKKTESLKYCNVKYNSVVEV